MFGSGGRVRFTAEGSKEIAIRRELQSLRNGDLTTSEIETRAEELAARTREVLATQVVSVGGPGSDDDAVEDGRPPADGAEGDDDRQTTTTTPLEPTTTTTPPEATTATTPSASTTTTPTTTTP